MIKLTGKERFNVQYILPVQGNLKTLELVENILDRVKIKEIKDIESDNLLNYEFTKEELTLMIESIKVLDESNKLNFQCLSLVKKILHEGEIKK
jgi:hypothetical protein